MRHLLLWMARSRILKRWLPRIWFVRRAVRRFMPGETVEEALDAAEFFRPHKIGILFTQLGENLTALAEAEAVADHYHRLLDMIAARGMDAEISVKPTQLGLDLDRDAAVRLLSGLADHAAQLHSGHAATHQGLAGCRRVAQAAGAAMFIGGCAYFSDTK